jgi:hypothetical protein
MASQISGHLWAPNGAYDALATVTVPSGGVSSVTFAGIPQGYKHLQVRLIARDSGSAGSNRNLFIRVNGDTANNYSWHDIEGVGSGAYSYAASTTNKAWTSYYPTASQTASTFNGAVIDFLDYNNTSKYKTYRSLGGVDINGDGQVSLASGLWQSTSAITSITFIAEQSGFAQYSQFALYGVK